MTEKRPNPGVAGLLVLGARILLAVTLRFLTAPLRWHRWDGAPTLFKDVFYTAIRTMLGNITIAQSRYIYPSTIDTYADLCKETQQQPKRIDLENATAVWIGEEAEDADVVILYLHGGGYTQPCTIGHMQYLYRLTKDLEADKDSTTTVSVLLLAYTLVPEAHYPTQLREAATVLSYLVSDKKRDPTTIMIGGDSAGGNLALSLLSHILHPHPDVPRVTLTAPLRGAMLYSPWVSFSTESASYVRNAGKDSLVENMLRKWGAMYLGVLKDDKVPAEVPSKTSGKDSYNEPLQNESIWWEGMHKVVGQVFVWMGEDEIFLDGLREFSVLFQDGWKNGGGHPATVQVYEAPAQPHIGPIMDVLMQDTKKSQSQLDIETWFKQRLA